MNLPFRTAFLALLLSLGLPVAAGAAASPFTDLAGRSQALGAYTGQGQWTVVMIWASDCGICRREAPDMEAFHQRFRGSVARVIGLSVDGPGNLDAARHFVREGGLSFANLVGDAEDVTALFYDETGNHLVGTPAFLIYDPQGVLRSYQTGRVNMLALERLVTAQPPVAVAKGP